MIRNRIFPSSQKSFQHRGKEIFRIEALSDAVFGFSVSLLVASLEVPRSFQELKTIAAGAIPFFATVAMIFFFWYRQYIFFRRFGVNDLTTIFLNLAYLAVILFYVYPLKFLFTLLLSYWSGIDFSGTGEGGFAFLSGEEFPQLVMLFSAGYLFIWLIVYLMHRHVLRVARSLEFTEYEWLFTRTETRAALLNMLVGSASLMLAWFQQVVLASWCYLAIPLVMAINDAVFKRGLKNLKPVQKSSGKRRKLVS